MLKDDSIDFVILTWNSRKVILPCLESVLPLPCCRRVFVVDNGSRDGTVECLRETVKNHPQGKKLELICNEANLGTTISRNIALRRIDSSVPYVCILDSDTEVNEEALTILVDVLEKNADCLLVGPSLVSKDGTYQSAARRYPTPWNKLMRAFPGKAAQSYAARYECMAGKDQTEPYPADYLMSACWLLKQSALSAVGLLDEKIFFAPEDVEYCTRIRRAGYRIMHCPKAKILHHWQRISKKKLLSYHNVQHLKGLGYLWRKYGFTGRSR